jgi:hypothetical protein
MLLGELLLLYLLAGAGVAGAAYRSGSSTRPGMTVARTSMAFLFWPMFLPLLLAGHGPSEDVPSAQPPSAPVLDELARLIGQVNSELDGALRSLDGWAEGVIAREKGRLTELRAAWNSQAQRIREMDRLLERAEHADGKVDGGSLIGDGTSASDEISARLNGNREVIRRNWDRLREVRRQTLDDLLRTLAWVRELVSMIHLAKFSGAPASRAEELVAQIAAAVEGLSAVSAPMEAS